MQLNQSFVDIENLIASGRFKEADRVLQANRISLQHIDGLRTLRASSELALFLGDLTGAERYASKILRDASDALTRSVAHRVLAEVRANELNFELSLAEFTSGRASLGGRESGDRVALELAYLGWFSGVLPLETVATEFAACRRLVLSHGKPAHFVELRLCAARLEARKGCLIEAQRHWDAAARTLDANPHLKLRSQLLLDGCMISLLSGDVHAALARAEEAGTVADDCGYFRIRIGSLIDRAHVLHITGSIDMARRLAEAAVAESVPYHQLRVAALDCLGNILIAQDDLAAAEAAFEQIARLRPKPGTKLALHWDVLSELSSRISLARAKAGMQDATRLVSEGLRTASANSDVTWLARMQLALAELRLNAGDVAGATEPLLNATECSYGSPELIARASATRGLAALKNGDSRVAAAEYGRSARIASAIESAALLRDLQNECSSLVSVLQPGRLDDAVAVLALAGYPHVLAREAFALLELTGAADEAAVLARSETAARCVATRGWSEADALAAINRSDILKIACGTHRDEEWEIVARLKAGLTDRCTGIAIRKLVDTAVTLDRYRREEKQRAALWPADTLETDGGLWVSEQMVELLSVARRIAPADISVLLTGETGTGKEVLARAIHRASGRAAKPFVPFNCTAVPRELLESQLFGHRRGAFTGAQSNFDGVIRAAAGGTLFLDEIAEIGPDLQPKLLRFLETREVHGLGETHPVKIDVRIVAATNADLEAMVAEGRFREDLFYRLNVARLRIPPLRERREEIPPLIEHYLRKFADEQKKGRLALDDETLEFLVLYRWPGNVRQLVNEVSRIVAYAEPDSTITPALLSPEVQASRRTVRVLPGDEPEIRVRLDQPLGDAIEALERMMVLRALDRANGNYENAAKLLGISRKGLFLKRRRWGMQRQAS